jgi:hypothetical protein
MTPPSILEIATLGNADALGFLNHVSEIAHTWDDLHDGDKKVSKQQIAEAFWMALITIPQNPFYRANESTLRPLLATSILNWQIANQLEDGDERLEIAYIIRSSYIDIALMCALLLGGKEHAASVGVGLRQWNHGETPSQYLENLKTQRAAQGA